jgi:hypothetical protein
MKAYNRASPKMLSFLPDKFDGSCSHIHLSAPERGGKLSFNHRDSSGGCAYELFRGRYIQSL